jgi:hypothetical protein
MIDDYESVAGLESLFQDAKAARQPYEADWMLNRAFFAGQQWVGYIEGSVRLPPRVDTTRQLVTDNRIMPIVTSRVARKVQNRPTFSATPQTGDDKALDSARIAERILENDWEGLKLHPKLFTALTWADVCCDGFIKIYWDSYAGQKMQALVGPDGVPLQNPNGGIARPEDAEMLGQMNPGILEGVTVAEIGQGDVACQVLSPFEIYPDPLATGMDDLGYIFEEKVRSLDYVRDRYPEDAFGQPFEPTPDSDVPSGLTEGFYPGTSDLFKGASTTSRGVKVREFRKSPCKRYPDGYMATWINNSVVVRSDAPDDPVPYTKFGSIEVPGRFWSRAITSDLRGPQVDLNTIQTQLKENARLMGNPSIMCSRHANVEYHGVPGERIDYDSTVIDAKPEYLVPPNMPVYVEGQIDRVQKSLEEISGIHEVSRATVPAGVTAASAINLLQEADATRLSPEIQQMEYSLGQWGTKILKLRAKYNTDARLIKISGEDGYWDIFSFKGEMLGDDPRVEVQAGSQMPRSKAAKQAAMTEVLGLVFQYGVPVDERNLRKFLKDYEAGGLDRLFEGMTEDAKQVNRENRQLAQGAEVPINTFDNHQFHIDEHTEEQKTARYQALPPEAKMQYDAHVAQHREYMVETANLQAQAQAESQAAQLEEQSRAEQQTEMVKAEGQQETEMVKAAVQPEPQSNGGQ